MTIFPPETLGLPSYGNRYGRLRRAVTDGGKKLNGSVESTRRFGRDVRYHYERDHL